jgi:hypothetical protein
MRRDSEISQESEFFLVTQVSKQDDVLKERPQRIFWKMKRRGSQDAKKTIERLNR